MSKFSIEQLPKEDLQALGLLKDGQLKLDQRNQDILLNGRITPLMRLDNINVDGLGIKSLDAKLSLQMKQDGNVGLYVHPIFKEPVAHPNLAPEENRDFSRGGAHEKQTSAYGRITDFGSAHYKDDPKNSTSYFVELEKLNGEKTKIWGVDLARALKESGKGIGDAVQLEFKGREFVQVELNGKYEQKERYSWNVTDFVPENKKQQSTIYEFDKETNSFVAVDSEDILVPEEVNGMPLSEDQKKKLKKGQVVDLEDGTAIQASPANAKNGFLQSNRKLLIASVLLDGGMSFVLIKGIQLLTEFMNRKKDENQEYNKGYRDALVKVQADLERKAKEYPNDKEILEDLNTVKAEFNRTATMNTYNDAEEKSINETKAVVNDPELDDNAERERGAKEAADRHTMDQYEDNERTHRRR
ncbi:MAG: DUF3945 domain-containing protein [Olivibacter sp.]|nr:DUF3945 domain-containing protein [Olivibacter sp. UJ_SKK_5.1]